GLDALAPQLSLDTSGCGRSSGACEVAGAIVSVSEASPAFGPFTISSSVVTSAAPTFTAIGVFPRDMALFAVAGALAKNTVVLPAAKLGVRRHVHPLLGVDDDAQDITLDTALDRSSTLTLESLPLATARSHGEAVPNVARVDVFLALGSDGVVPIASSV